MSPAISCSVSIPFVRADPKQNPNLKIGAQDPSSAYFKAMIVTFASFRKFNPMLKLQLVSNMRPPEDYEKVLRELDVEIAITPFNHRPPEGFTSRFTASLYLIDSLRVLSEQTNIIVDPDVLCLTSLDKVIAECEAHVGVLPIDYPPNHDINGLSRLGASEIHQALGEPPELPLHFGGEIYVIPCLLLNDVIQRTENGYRFALERHLLGMSKFTTEEHILSYSLRGLPIVSLSAHIRRIWTAHRHRGVNGQEHQLSMWHLPAEKDRGFDSLFDVAVDHSSWFWNCTQQEFINKAGRAMGLHHRRPGRWTKDLGGQIVAKILISVATLRKFCNEKRS